MTKVRLEFDFDELMVLMFGMQKARHYTQWFDPSFMAGTEFEDKKKYMQTYHDMLFKIRCVLIAWNTECPKSGIADMAKHPLNYSFIEVDNEKDKD